MSGEGPLSPTAFAEGEGGLSSTPIVPGRWASAGPISLSGFFGFVAGLPLAITGPALLQWLRDGHAALAIVGLTANIGLPYALKFLWAPVLDRMRPPPGLRALGQRRGWLIPIQLVLTASCTAFAFCDPAGAPYALLGVSTVLAFASANQDIVIDAWRIEAFPERLQGNALASYIWGYRIALLVGGPGAIRLSAEWGWRPALLVMAALVATGLLATLLAREPPRAAAQPGAWFRHAVVAPLRDLLGRPSAGRILLFVALFKLGEALAHRVAYSFYGDMGFTARQVADATGVPGLLASLAGAALGGWLVLRIGAARALVTTGFVQMASMAMYFALAVSHGDPWVLLAKIVVENVAEAMADAAFLTYLARLCSPAYTATQYALLSSLAALGLRTVGGVSGTLAEAMGWVPFYAMTIFAAVPAMLVMVSLLRRPPPGAPGA